MKDQTSNVFEALAHPTRRQILQDLKNGELTAGDIAAKPQATRCLVDSFGSADVTIGNR